MTRQWTIIHFEETFLYPLEQRGDRIITALRSRQSPAEQQATIREWEELRAFCKRLANAERAEIYVAALYPAVDENGRPLASIYCLRVGPYCAYYRVSHDDQICLGLLTRHDKDPKLTTISGALADALSRHRQGLRDD